MLSPWYHTIEYHTAEPLAETVHGKLHIPLECLTAFEQLVKKGRDPPEIHRAGLTFITLVTMIIQRVKCMAKEQKHLTRLLIFNLLFLVLTVVITINLLETGDRPVSQEMPAVNQTQ